MYGTSKEAVESVRRDAMVCVLDIDIQGVRQVRECQARREFDAAMYIFVAPPSMEALEVRLRGRGTEKEEKIAVRLSNARTEIRDADAIPWDHYIVNDDLDAAAAELARATKPLFDACSAAKATN
jgi:guanylate kinase